MQYRSTDAKTQEANLNAKVKKNVKNAMIDLQESIVRKHAVIVAVAT